jgi:hypothetical protein
MGIRRVAACLVLGAASVAGCEESRDVAGPSPSAPSVSNPPAGSPSPHRDEFVSLSLADFVPFKAEPDTWSEADGVLSSTGKPKGYLYSKKAHRNFTWQAEFRLPVPPDVEPEKLDQLNTGFMLWIQEPHKVWPKSLEVQGKLVEIGSIRTNGGAAAVTTADNAEARTKAHKPAGEWNAVEIECRDGAVTSRINGVVIAECQPGELREGLIGLQAENNAVEFRNLQIRDNP